MPWILLLILIVFLIVKRKELGFLKNKFYLVLAILSVIAWAYMTFLALNTDPVCAPNDALCNSGNTFWGDVTWVGAIMLVFLSFIWTPAILIGYYISKHQK